MMGSRDWMTLGIVAGVAYGLYKLVGPGSPGAKAADAVGGAIGWVVADFYTWAVLQRQNMNLVGNILLPGGTLVPLQDVDVRQSPAGAVFAEFQGHFYQLSPSDVNGNWPAALVQ